LVAAPKKDANGNWKKTRVCLDLRQLNSQLLFEDRHPLPKIKDLLRNFGSCKFFSMLDLKEAFLQLPVAITDRHKLTFTWNNVQYYFNYAIFGLTPLSHHLQRVMSIMLHNIPDVHVFVDILSLLLNLKKIIYLL
jgi:hypothetical protein